LGETPLANILVVEDDLDVAEMLSVYFRIQGYSVRVVNWGKEAIQVCFEKLPDIILLDIRLPDIDGFEVATRLRSNRRTANVPIIFLTEKRDRPDRLKGLELKADDYMTKPFDVQELRLRVRNIIGRTRSNSPINPITNLPEGDLVNDRLRRHAKDPETAYLVISLERMDEFRELYGFSASDDLLKVVSLMLEEVKKTSDHKGNFLGQIGPQDFLLITHRSLADGLAGKVQKRLGQSFEYFYNKEDRNSESIHSQGLGVRVDIIPSGVEDMDQLWHTVNLNRSRISGAI
jgi:DNA-binding response OmpR family regulator